jgi:4-hydroxy-tetrahydrodipicolinate synthase
MAFKMEGAFTAIITPFRGGMVDTDALEALVERQIEGGIDGLVPCGTTGESATMSEDERLLVIETVVEKAAGRVPVVAGTATNDTRKSIAFTKRVAQIEGVDAALVVTPYYNKPSQTGLVRHFTEIADEGGLPVVLYNVPGRTAVSMTADTVAQLAEHEQIVAIKEATGDMVLGSRIVELAGDNITLLSGDDFTTFPLLAIGARGCTSVASNIVPGHLAKMCAAANSGDLETARRLHYELLPLARALFCDTNPVPVKAAAALLDWCGTEIRGPLYPADDATRSTVEEALRDYGLFE